MEMFVQCITILFVISANCLAHGGELLDLPLVQLLSLKDENCDTVYWCTLNARANATFDPERWKTDCCQRCSCEKKCVEKKDCCPDYELAMTLGIERAYGNFSDLLFALENQPRVRTILEANVTYSNKADTNTIHESLQTECVKAQISKHRFSPNGLSYEMVSRCHGTYTKNTTTRDKCETSLDEIENQLFDEIIPVSSLESGLVFKNKHCLECNFESNASVSMWTMVIVCTETHNPLKSDSWFYENPYELLKDVRLNSYSGYDCNSIFEPKQNIVQKYPPITCTAIDVKECEHNTNTSGILNVNLFKACSTFQSPVTVESSYVVQVYNNIACVYCNGMTKFNKKCYSSQVKSAVRLQLNRVYVKSEYPWPELNDSLSFLRIQFDDRNTAGRCETGHVYDETKDVCRKVFCPHGMFVFNGSCVAMFDQVNDINYRLVMKVNFSEETIHNLTDFESNLYSSLKSVVERNEDISIDHLSLWKTNELVNEVGVDDYYVYVLLSSNGTYFHVTKSISTILHAIIEVQTETDTVEAKLLIISYVERKRKSLVDVIKNKVLQIVLPLNTTLNTSSHFIPIFKSNFCYRVCINKSEVQYIGKYMLTVKATGAIVYRDVQHKRESESELICTCIVYALTFELKHQHTTTRIQESETPSSGKVNSFPEFYYIVIIIGILLIICILVTVFRVIMDRRTMETT